LGSHQHSHGAEIGFASGAESIDWVGTSMGGRLGMLLAAEANTPIRRLVINDAGPLVPRIGAHVTQNPVFDDLEGVQKYMREIYAPFGDLSGENWRHLARQRRAGHAGQQIESRLGSRYRPAFPYG
jgi:pimeloyl-ACP methyl ester carboxylesterase